MQQATEKTDKPILLTTEQAAEAANCPISAIKRLIEIGKLPVVQLTRKCTRINANDLMEVFQKQRLVCGVSRNKNG